MHTTNNNNFINCNNNSINDYSSLKSDDYISKINPVKGTILSNNTDSFTSHPYTLDINKYNYEPFYNDKLSDTYSKLKNNYQYNDKYRKLKNSIEDLSFKISHENKKKVCLMEKIFVNNKVLQHPAMNIFMANPSLINNIQNQYLIRKENKFDEIGQDPNDSNSNEIEVGKEVMFNKQDYLEYIKNLLKEIERLKNELKNNKTLEEKSIISSKISEKTKVIEEYKSLKSENNKDMKNRIRELWRIARAFKNISLYYFIRNKLSKKRSIKLHDIEQHRKQLRNHQSYIIDWFKDTQQSFINDLLVDSDLNLAFNNNSGSVKIKNQSEKIISLINLLLRNLINSSSQSSMLPINLLEALKIFCNNNVYVAKKLLSTYEIFRLDFALDGRIINHTETTIAMLIAFFVFSKTFVYRIFLKIHDNYKQFKNYKHILLNLKYISSILIYLIHDAFNLNPNKMESILVYLNYLKSYQIKNKEIFQLKDIEIIKDASIKYTNYDEFAIDLIPREAISEFFIVNKSSCDKIKKIIIQWSVELGKYIRKNLLFINTD